jgi:hypothetical protein
MVNVSPDLPLPKAGLTPRPPLASTCGIPQSSLRFTISHGEEYHAKQCPTRTSHVKTASNIDHRVNKDPKLLAVHELLFGSGSRSEMIYTAKIVSTCKKFKINEQ